MERGKRHVYEDDEDEPLEIADSGKVIDKTAEMCLLGKLWTERNYNMFAMLETMKKLWKPSKGMTCSELGTNLVSFQFNTKRDMERVQSMEPWSFNKHILVLMPLASDIQPSMMKFDRVPCWIRIYDIPMRGREEGVIRQIGQRFGEVLELDKTTIGGLSRSVRMKIRLNLNNALKRGTKIRVGTSGPCWIPITYERISSFCYWCGKLGHTHKDCESFYERPNADVEVTEENMSFGAWMKVSPLKKMHLSSQRSTKEHENIRKSLFQREANIPEKEQELKAWERNEETNEKQVSELLKSLEKVEMSALPNEKISPAITKVPPTQKAYIPTKIHTPTTMSQKTTINNQTSLPKTSQNKPTSPKPVIPISSITSMIPKSRGEPSGIPKQPYTPTETLIKMVAATFPYPEYIPLSTLKNTPSTAQNPQPIQKRSYHPQKN